MIAFLAITMVATSFLSGVFGMAGGMVLMGVLLAIYTLPEAMALHAITQVTSNGVRGFLWVKHVQWRAVAWFLTGCALAFILVSLWRYVPSKGVTLILLGMTPLLVNFMPSSLKPNPAKPLHSIGVGGVSMFLMLISGASGPIIDTFFLNGKFDRLEVIATKAMCQTVCHGAKFVYFGTIIDQAGVIEPYILVMAIIATIVGSALAKPMLERLSEANYRLWATRIITVIGLVYISQGLYQIFMT
jgi:uncharacterized protein